jgi:hypothetical protein
MYPFQKGDLVFVHDPAYANTWQPCYVNLDMKDDVYVNVREFWTTEGSLGWVVDILSVRRAAWSFAGPVMALTEEEKCKPNLSTYLTS